jgi:hypothetical protein
MHGIEPPKSLDVQKHELEKAKLEFEVRKFDADQSKRQWELEKLIEEVREIKKKWFLKPDYLGPTSAVIVAIIGGSIAFGTDIFKSNVVKLVAERDTLKRSVSTLTLDEENLKHERQRLSIENAKLSSDQLKLKSQADSLRENANHLMGENASLAEDLQLSELKTQLKVIEDPSDGTPLDLSNKSFQFILNKLAVDKSRDAISLIEHAYSKDQSPYEVKAALAFALFKATKKNEWKAALRSTAIYGAETKLNPTYITLDAPIYFELLKDPSVFLSDERATILQEMYRYVKAVPLLKEGDLFTWNQKDRLSKSLQTLATWDREATIKFRDPWFDYVSRVFNLEDNCIGQRNSFGLNLAFSVDSGCSFGNMRQSSDPPKLFTISPEAYGILLLRTLQGPPEVSFEDGHWPIEALMISRVENHCPDFPDSFPLCQDWKNHLETWKEQNKDKKFFSADITNGYQIWHTSMPNYASWLEQNRKLVALWSDPSFRGLRVVDDKTMGKIFDKEWIGPEELKN